MEIPYTPIAPHIAYAVHGAGAETLIVVPGWVGHLIFDWETPDARSNTAGHTHGASISSSVDQGEEGA
jgi:hypothetical protein